MAAVSAARRLAARFGRAGGPVARMLARLVMLAGCAVVGFLALAMLDGSASADDRSHRDGRNGLLDRVVDAEPRLTRRLSDQLPPPTVDRRPPVRVPDRARVPGPGPTLDRRSPVRTPERKPSAPAPDRTPSVPTPDRTLSVPAPDRVPAVRTTDRAPAGRLPVRDVPVRVPDGDLTSLLLDTGATLVFAVRSVDDVVAAPASAVPPLPAAVPRLLTAVPRLLTVVPTAATVVDPVVSGATGVVGRLLPGLPTTAAGPGLRRHDVMLLQRAGPVGPESPCPDAVVPLGPAAGTGPDPAPPAGPTWRLAAEADVPGPAATPRRPAGDPAPVTPVPPRRPDGVGPSGQRVGQAGGGAGQAVTLPAGAGCCTPPRADPTPPHIDAYGAGRWPAVPALPG
ncbi:hypothetical protein [Plantactinospora sp. B5E13]|uniref:hypothetical protein n=1 Tax=unclassified Plantactinospora TaxID=2631981 RepID=UPI00325C4661